MDAISSATARSHVAHDATWDMKDLAGKLVADGKYTLRIEVTEGPSNSKSDAIEFQKGPMAQMIMAPDTVPYSGLTLNYQP